VYVAGAPVDWTAVDRGYRRRKVPLPTYPFQRESYWLAPGSDAVRAETGHPLLGRRLELAIADTVYEARLAGRSLGWLRGPGAALGLLDLALAAARRRWPGRAVTLAALRMLAPTPPGEDVVLQSAIDRHDRLTVSARAGGDSWTVLATASLAEADALPGGASRPGFELPRIDAKAGFVLHPDRLSACLRRASEAVGGMPLGVAEATVASEGEPMHAAIELEAGAVALTLTDIDGRSIAVLRTSPVAVSEVPALAAQP
jgi:acyl transferase domain-containing protein